MHNYLDMAEWAKTLDYIVVNDIYWGDTTPWADIALPACSPIGSDEPVGRIIANYNCVRLRQKVIDPLSWIDELAQRAESSSSTGYYTALPRLASALMTALAQTAHQR